MEIHNDILNNINSRYVLLKKDIGFIIIDKTKKSMVIINDPIIDKEKLIQTMIEKGVEVYDNPNKLPQPSEIPFNGKDIPTAFKLFIKKIHDKDGKETGAIISALTNHMIDINEKRRIERIMEDYAFTVLYPNEGLNIYSDVNFDTASLTIIKGINNLSDQDINWTETQLYKW